MGRLSQQQAEPLSALTGLDVRENAESEKPPGSTARAILDAPFSQRRFAENAAVRSMQVAYDRLKQEPIPDHLLAVALRLR